MSFGNVYTLQFFKFRIPFPPKFNFSPELSFISSSTFSMRYQSYLVVYNSIEITMLITSFLIIELKFEQIELNN